MSERLRAISQLKLVGWRRSLKGPLLAIRGAVARRTVGEPGRRRAHCRVASGPALTVSRALTSQQLASPPRHSTPAPSGAGDLR